MEERSGEGVGEREGEGGGSVMGLWRNSESGGFCGFIVFFFRVWIVEIFALFFFFLGEGKRWKV